MIYDSDLSFSCCHYTFVQVITGLTKAHQIYYGKRISLVLKWLQQLKQKAKHLKQEVEVLLIAYKDKRTPIAAKLLIAITAGYLLSPIDLIPDFIPVLGLLDDLIIVPLLITFSLKIIPTAVLNDARASVNTGANSIKKRNWIAAFCIVALWLVVIYSLYRHFV